MLFRSYMFVSLIILLYCSLASSSCPTQKVSRKIQKLRLESLTTTDVVVECLYQGTIDGFHWFLIEQVWTKNNGNFNPGDKIYVDISSNAPYWQCFRKLYLDESYFLMLQRKDAESKIYKPLEPPVFSYFKKLRQAIWQELCSVEENSFNSCEMRITLPHKVVYYQGQAQSLKCKVDSSFPVTKVTWYKDGSTLVTKPVFGLTVDINEKDFSVVTFDSVSAMHVGVYKCLVTNEAGESAHASTDLRVAGPLKLSHFRPCNEPGFCFNGGVCRQMHDAKKRCECIKPFYGERCAEFIDISSVDEAENNEDMKQAISNLTTAVTAVSITLFFVLVLCLMYIKRMHRKYSQHKDADKSSYDEVELATLKPNGEITHEQFHTPPVFTSKGYKSPVRILVEDAKSFDFGVTPIPSPNPSYMSKNVFDQDSIKHSHDKDSTPRTPLSRISLSNDQHSRLSVSRPATPCSSQGTPHTPTRRDRLYAKS